MASLQTEINGHAEAAAGNTGITADEIALYDRQIRLWGVQAQEKIRHAAILLIGMRALANEIAKNLTLAGVRSITLLDSATVTECDLGAQFLVEQADVGKPRAEAAAVQLRKLNPRVQVIADNEDSSTKGPSYFEPFDVVIATDLLPATLELVNTATRLHHKAFYAAGTYGLYGYIFADLIRHEYVLERQQGNRTTRPGPETRTRSVLNVATRKDGSKSIELVTKQEVYSTWLLSSDVATLPREYHKRAPRLKAVTPILSCLRALWAFQNLHGSRLPATKEDLAQFTKLATEKHKALGLPDETLRADVLRKFLQNLGSELAPVTAVLGGQLAQDVINVLGRRQQPIQNMVVFDGEAMEAPMYALHPEGELGDELLPMSTASGVLPAAVDLTTADVVVV